MSTVAGFSSKIVDGHTLWVEEGHAESELLFVWREKMDAKKGKPYYVNQQTKASVWALKPSGSGEAASPPASPKEKKEKSDKKLKSDKKVKKPKDEDDVASDAGSTKSKKKSKSTSDVMSTVTDGTETASPKVKREKRDKSEKKEKKEKKSRATSEEHGPKSEGVSSATSRAPSEGPSSPRKEKKDKKKSKDVVSDASPSSPTFSVTDGISEKKKKKKAADPRALLDAALAKSEGSTSVQASSMVEDDGLSALLASIPPPATSRLLSEIDDLFAGGSGSKQATSSNEANDLLVQLGLKKADAVPKQHATSEQDEVDEMLSQITHLPRQRPKDTPAPPRGSTSDPLKVIQQTMQQEEAMRVGGAASPRAPLVPLPAIPDTTTLDNKSYSTGFVKPSFTSVISPPYTLDGPPATAKPIEEVAAVPTADDDFTNHYNPFNKPRKLIGEPDTVSQRTDLTNVQLADMGVTSPSEPSQAPPSQQLTSAAPPADTTPLPQTASQKAFAALWDTISTVAPPNDDKPAARTTTPTMTYRQPTPSAPWEDIPSSSGGPYNSDYQRAPSPTYRRPEGRATPSSPQRAASPSFIADDSPNSPPLLDASLSQLNASGILKPSTYVPASKGAAATVVPARPTTPRTPRVTFSDEGKGGTKQEAAAATLTANEQQLQPQPVPPSSILEPIERTNETQKAKRNKKSLYSTFLEDFESSTAKTEEEEEPPVIGREEQPPPKIMAPTVSTVRASNFEHPAGNSMREPLMLPRSSQQPAAPNRSMAPSLSGDSDFTFSHPYLGNDSARLAGNYSTTAHSGPSALPPYTQALNPSGLREAFTEEEEASLDGMLFSKDRAPSSTRRTAERQYAASAHNTDDRSPSIPQPPTRLGSAEGLTTQISLSPERTNPNASTKAGYSGMQPSSEYAEGYVEFATVYFADEDIGMSRGLPKHPAQVRLEIADMALKYGPLYEEDSSPNNISLHANMATAATYLRPPGAEAAHRPLATPDLLSYLTAEEALLMEQLKERLQVVSADKEAIKGQARDWDHLHSADGTAMSHEGANLLISTRLALAARKRSRRQLKQVVFESYLALLDDGCPLAKYMGHPKAFSDLERYIAAREEGVREVLAEHFKPFMSTSRQ